MKNTTFSLEHRQYLDNLYNKRKKNFENLPSEEQKNRIAKYRKAHNLAQKKYYRKNREKILEYCKNYNKNKKKYNT